MSKILREFWPVDAEAFPEFKALGIDPMKVPMPAYTALDGFDPVACWGFIPLVTGIAEGWMVLRLPLDGNMIWVCRAVRESIQDLLDKGIFEKIQASIVLGRPDHERFARFLKMSPERMMYSRTRRS